MADLVRKLILYLKSVSPMAVKGRLGHPLKGVAAMWQIGTFFRSDF
jgi:hypothetical protein